MRGLAADARAGIEDALPRPRCRNVADELRTRILHRPLPGQERGAACRIACALEPQRHRREVDRRRRDTGGGELERERLARGAQPVHACDERWGLTERGHERREIERRTGDRGSELVEDPSGHRVLDLEALEQRLGQRGFTPGRDLA